VDKSNQDIVQDSMRLLGCDLRELFKRACSEKKLGRNSIEQENRAKAGYRRFRDEHVYPDYLIDYCLDVLRKGGKLPAENVRNLDAFRHGVTDINKRRTRKR
jgi:hypothetical protein